MIEQREALLRLLRDDDPSTVALVKNQLARTGIDGLEELQSLLSAADAASALHLHDVIAEIEEQQADALFSRFCAEFSESSDLEDAAWRLAATFSPGEDFLSQRGKLDAWAAEVSRRLNKAQTPLDRIETLTEYLSDEVKLRGNEEDYYEIDNSLLPQVIETGLGIPISLCLIYMLVGRRAGLEIFGVGLPGHFLIRYEEFFFDPFHGGRRVGLNECRALMEQQNLVLRPEHLIPPTPRQILIRILTNIYYVAESTDPALAAKVADWIAALKT